MAIGKWSCMVPVTRSGEKMLRRTTESQMAPIATMP